MSFGESNDPPNAIDGLGHHENTIAGVDLANSSDTRKFGLARFSGGKLEEPPSDRLYVELNDVGFGGEHAFRDFQL